MPPIKIQHVVSCSSEDSVHKAENMLVSDHFRKWKGASAGEKQLALILRFEQSSRIHSVDIGNEGSAFVEVLVGRSSTSSSDFQVLIVSSSFMTPTESRQGSNTNRVRIFGPDKLSQIVTKEKWDLVKIVCTQPFNKSIQYGLSFIAFHSPPDKSETNGTASNTQTMLGAFKLKDADESESKISVGSFFAKRKGDSQDPDVASGSASTSDLHKIRYGDAAEIIPKKIKKIVKDVGSAETPPKKEPSESRKSLSSTSTPKTSTNESKPSLALVKKETPKHDKPDSHSKRKDDNNNNSVPSSSKAGKTSSKNLKPPPPFHKLLDGVVFVLSGYQNPQRRNIRDKAIEMGATYKPDWDRNCTHLICAFTNTPKFQQVQKKGGRIVTEKWILECHKQKRLLSWRQFVLGKSKAPETSESEDSDRSDAKPESKQVTKPKDAQAGKPAKISPPEKVKTDDGDTSTNKRFSFNDSSNSVNNDIQEFSDSEGSGSEVYRAATDVDSNSGNDTEGEIAKVVAKKSSAARSVRIDTSSIKMPDLLDIFEGEHFFLYGEFSNEERKSLVRYIIGCGGVVEEFMTKDVKCVLTNSSWKKDFTDAVAENKALRILSPFWVIKCVESGCVVPKKDYFIAKK